MCQKTCWDRSGSLRGSPGMVFWRIFVKISREIDNRKLVRKLAENREPHLGQLHQQQKSWTKTSKRTGQPTRMHKFLGCGGLALAFSIRIGDKKGRPAGRPKISGIWNFEISNSKISKFQFFNFSNVEILKFKNNLNFEKSKKKKDKRQKHNSKFWSFENF